MEVSCFTVQHLMFFRSWARALASARVFSAARRPLLRYAAVSGPVDSMNGFRFHMDSCITVSPYKV